MTQSVVLVFYLFCFRKCLWRYIDSVLPERMPSLKKKMLRHQGDKAKCKVREVTGSKLDHSCWWWSQFSVLLEWVQTRQITGPRTVPKVLSSGICHWSILQSSTQAATGYPLRLHSLQGVKGSFRLQNMKLNLINSLCKWRVISTGLFRRVYVPLKTSHLIQH